MTQFPENKRLIISNSEENRKQKIIFPLFNHFIDD